MKFGLGFAPKSLYAGDYSLGEWTDATVVAEKAGFDSTWVTEDYYGYDSLTILGFISARTKKLKLAPGIINPYTRHLSLIAMSITTLDVLSGGRAILGLGSGGSSVSFSVKSGEDFWKGTTSRFQDQMGISAASPYNKMRDAIIGLRKLLAGEKVNRIGNSPEVHNIKLEVRPVQTSIPIYLGQVGPRMLRLAGEFADGVLLSSGSSIEYVRKAKKWIEESAKKSNRNPSDVKIACRVIFGVTSSVDTKVYESAKRYVAYMVSASNFRHVMNPTGYDADSVKEIIDARLKGDEDGMIKSVSDEMIKSFTVIGDRQYCYERIQEYIEAGVDTAVIVPIAANPLEAINSIRATQSNIH